LYPCFACPPQFEHVFSVAVCRWDHIWLNEAFASYVEYIGTDEYAPTWGVWDHFLISDAQRALSADARETTHPIHFNVETPGQVEAMFDVISYSKGASVIRMLGSWLEWTAPGAFNMGLQAYLDAHKFSTATSADLFAAWSVP
jgi:aminopeptidase N